MEQQQLWNDVLPYLQPPSRTSEFRVVEMEVGSFVEHGAGKIRINPWLDTTDPEQVATCDIDALISHGMPLSLASAITGGSLSAPLQVSALTLLSMMARASPGTCDQLNRNRVLPLVPRPQSSREGSVLLAEIEHICKQALGESQHKGNTEWTGWAPFYEVWLRSNDTRLAKVYVRGVEKSLGMFDMGGVHLTGGRLWAGALLLIRWLGALNANSDVQLGTGPILEIGAGIGLVGIALAKLGHRVVLSDREPLLLEAMDESMKSNQVEENCRILNLSWDDVKKPKIRRMLGAQRFGAVIGADLIYDGRPHAELVVGVVRHALPNGGIALFTQAQYHRRTPNVFGDVLREAGFEVVEGFIKCAGIMQDVFCGDFEPNQEYAMYTVTVPPIGTNNNVPS